MHMADALISPAVGGTMWVASVGLLTLCARKVRLTLDAKLVPLMGVLGAFIFTAMMINFSIPATGSSGHLGGGLLLAIMLGPYAAFIVIASVLSVQALFFADGGLLALGCNIFNLGFFPVFMAYPLIYKPIMGGARGGVRLWLGALLAAIIGLQLGAFSVVLETTISGRSDLPFRTFVLLMQPIHLAIGVVEGVATAAVVAFVLRTRPEALPEPQAGPVVVDQRPRVIIGFLMAAVMVGGVGGWFASTYPDGLEWAMGKARGEAALVVPNGGVHAHLVAVQEQTAFLPEYDFKTSRTADAIPAVAERPADWPSVKAGRSVAGLVGGLMTLVLAGLIGYGLRQKVNREE